MNKYLSWREFSRQWWGLPVLCALVLINLSSWLSPIILLPEGRTYLMYMPLAVCVALLMVFDWRALPGIALAMLVRYDLRIGIEMGVLLTVIYLFTLSVAWGGYRAQSGTRWSASFGLLRLPLPHIMWLVVFLSVFFVFILQIIVELDLLPGYLGMVTSDFMTLRTLINLQAMLLGTLLSGHLWYLVLRIIRKPRYLRVLRAKMRSQRAPGVKAAEVVIWFLLLGAMVVMLSLQGISGPVAKILLSDYTLTLLLPVLLFGAMRYGYHFITIVWTITLIVLFNHYRGFISQSGFIHNLVFVSALMLVFTLSLLMMSAISSRQRRLLQKTRSASLLDPVFGLPNLRAFNRDLSRYPRSLLCFIRVSEMDVLSRNYGMQLRIQFKQQLVVGLKPFLQPDERVYHLPGYDLVLRLNCDDTEEKLERLQHYVDDFRLIWNGLPLHPNIGLAYCTVFPPVEHLHMLLGELSGIAEVSLTTGKPESNKSDHSQVQKEIKGKVEMLHKVQRALDEDRFILMAQPIAGVRGDNYHEILLRMLDESGDLMSPDKFLPVVHEFGLAYQLDMWVLKHTLMFIHQHREKLPSARFAVNFSPSTFCRPAFSSQFKTLMAQYQVEPFQIVLEVTESQLLHNVKYADYSMRDLRNYGCRIAIDDFGTGYASYDRLKLIQADILKIDGSFVRNMLTDPLYAYIVQSICQVARMKHLSIVAEYVETEEQCTALRAQGVDYMQGYLIGKPEPLITLISHQTPVSE
ncbi:cyclic-di-GMP phosphodiesterase [Enterobacterales bacterium]|nr:cyclic-di-GMP phosphodiesterase [Enterobacterales bacterium]